MTPETRLIILTILAIRREDVMRYLRVAQATQDVESVDHWERAREDVTTAIKAMEAMKP